MLSLFVRCTAIMMTFALVLPALAGEPPFPEAKVKEFALAILKAAHPTGKNPTLLQHSFPKREGVILIKLELSYAGAASKKLFTADALLEIQPPKKPADPFEVLRIDFVDKNNPVVANQKNLKKLIEELNMRLRIEKAK